MKDWEIEDAASIQVGEWFEKYDDLYLKTDAVDHQFEVMKFIHNKIKGTKCERGGVISGADHDVIFLNYGSWTYYEEKDIKFLVEHGVTYDDGYINIGA